MVKHRLKRNCIQGIKSVNDWISEPSQVKSIFKDHFRSFFNKDPGSLIFDIGSLLTNKLSVNESKFLDEKFILQEIHATLSLMNSNKSPGPDEINIDYYKRLWNVIHGDILSMFEKFHEHNTLPQGVNSSFIVLISKRDTPEIVADYRPISLINCSIKILLKLLSNRLSNVLHSLVLEVQSSFVKNRNISDSLFISNEVVHSIQSNRVQGLILKLDFAKAFDSVNWSFLFHVMEHMSFLRNGWGGPNQSSAQ